MERMEMGCGSLRSCCRRSSEWEDSRVLKHARLAEQEKFDEEA